MSEDMNRRFSHGGNIYDAKPAQGEWLDFSANINPLGLSPLVRQAIEDGIPHLVHYPDPSARALKQAISDHYDIPLDRIVLGNGGAELFYVLFHAARPKRVLLPIPSFSEYERAAISAKAEVAYFSLREEDGFRFDETALCTQMRTGDCLIMGSPNNPTGRRVERKALEAILQEARRKDVLMIIDESFMDFCPDAVEFTARSLVSQYDNLIIVQSLTKFFAIPGLRLGFAIASTDIVEWMDAAKDPWNTNILAQAAGVAALADVKYQRRTLAWLDTEREFLFQALGALDGVKVYPPTVNFILLRLSSSLGNASNFCARMREEGILLRDCSNYPGLDDTFVRVAVRKREENEKLLEALRKIGDERK